MAQLKRNIVVCWILFMSIFLSSVCVNAGTVVYNSAIQDDELDVYFVSDGDVSDLKCQVGQRNCTLIDMESAEIDTVILIDNSLSIQDVYRKNILELAKGIVEKKTPEEKVTIATFDTTLHYLVKGEKDKQASLNCIDSITFQNLDTKLTDVLHELYENFEADSPYGFKRVVLFSDGMDYSAIGYTKEELIEEVKSKGYPIYIFGCTYKNNVSELENMFRLARETKGLYYLMDSMKSSEEIYSDFAYSSNLKCIKVIIPEDQCDGSEKGIRVSFKDAEGTISEFSLKQTMPLLDIKESVITEEPQPTEEPIPTEEPQEMEETKTTEEPQPTEEPEATEEPETTEEPQPTEAAESNVMTKDNKDDDVSGNGATKNYLLFIIIGVVAAIIIIIFLAIVIFMKIRRPGKIQSGFNEPGSMKGEDDSTQTEEDDDYVPTEDAEEDEYKDTEPIENFTITLTDIDNYTHTHKMELSSMLVIGRRKEECQIVIDYAGTVSGRHCKLFLQDGIVWVKDLGSKNGTSVNGKLVEDECIIETGDILKLGKLQLKISIEE